MSETGKGSCEKPSDEQLSALCFKVTHRDAFDGADTLRLNPVGMVYKALIRKPASGTIEEIANDAFYNSIVGIAAIHIATINKTC